MEHTQDVQQRNAAVVRSYFDEVWNSGDLTAIDRYFGDDFTNFGQKGADARGLIRRIVEAWRTAFPDLHFTVEEEIAHGDAVVHRMTCSGTHVGAFEHPAFGLLPPTGRTFAVDHMHLHKLRDGRIFEHWGTRNDLAMLQQLGALESPEVPPDMSARPGWKP